mmetsp:Transcript_74405/g.206595  ORF Transcript_74405/g.206595 Transcript_74405/m.206595 type:complete len:221 (+) Transcript_74405:128-790(+)
MWKPDGRDWPWSRVDRLGRSGLQAFDGRPQCEADGVHIAQLQGVADTGARVRGEKPRHALRAEVRWPEALIRAVQLRVCPVQADTLDVDAELFAAGPVETEVAESGGNSSSLLIDVIAIHVAVVSIHLHVTARDVPLGGHSTEAPLRFVVADLNDIRGHKTHKRRDPGRAVSATLCRGRAGGVELLLQLLGAAVIVQESPLNLLGSVLSDVEFALLHHEV